jgi:hypothetical protein
MTAARRSYDKRRAASMASSVAALQRLAGGAPVTVALAASPSAWFVATAPSGSVAGRYQIVAMWIEGFVAGWTLAGGQGFHQGQDTE